jgi:hypothetical protein
VKTDSPDLADFATTPLAYRAVTSAICQRSAQGALPDMPQPADFGGFISVPAAICQRPPKPLCEVPRIANGLDAES